MPKSDGRLKQFADWLAEANAASETTYAVHMPDVPDTEAVPDSVPPVVQRPVPEEVVAAPAHAPGTRLRVTFDAVVDEHGGWIESKPNTVVLALPGWPFPHKAGCIVSAGGALWVTRRSNKRDSLRVMPVDLSGRLRTLPLEAFMEKYPKAKLIFRP